MDMIEVLMARGARSVVERCASISPGDRVLIVTDFDLVKSAVVLAQAAHAVGAEVSISIMAPREVDGQEPPDSIAAAMKKADVILTPVSKSLAHTRAVKEALTEGARVLSLTALTGELLASDAWEADFEKQRPVVEKVARIFTEANEVRIRSPAGTDLTVRADGRQGNAHSCIVKEPGQFSGAPNIEANFSPVEGTAQGTFIADGSIPYLGIGLLTQPVTFVIQHGKVVRIEGGKEAQLLKSILEEQQDPNVYNIAQVAVGLNPKIKAPVGRLGCNYDEGAFGTVHIGIGTSSNIGGQVKASTHFDAVMNNPTVEVDGRVIVKNGQLMI